MSIEMNKIRVLMMLPVVMLLSSCQLAEYVEERAEVVNRYEDRALELARENRELKVQLSRVENENGTLKSNVNYLQSKIDRMERETEQASRMVASVAPVQTEAPSLPANEDKVQFDVYKWSPEQILAMAEREFNKGNYMEAAQYFNAFITEYPKHEKLDDKVLFQAGVASYESGKYFSWVHQHMGTIVKDYPTSAFFRGAKLWIGLTFLREGNEKKFYDTAEEFRKKYKNTKEWKILSKHYEKIVQRHKEQM